MRNQSEKKTSVVVSFVEQPENMRETAYFESFWRDQGADFVVIRRLHSAGGAKKDIAAKLNNICEQRRPCVYPWERVVLSSHGYLSFCPDAWTRESDIADYQDTTIKNIWQGEFYERLRNAHLRNEFSRYSFCKQCPDWIQVRWPEEGRSYADMVEEFSQDTK